MGPTKGVAGESWAEVSHGVLSRIKSAHLRATLTILGNVTDYGSTMVQWMRNRRPQHRGGPTIEAERPSASYIVDVRTEINTTLACSMTPGSDVIAS